jgi:hypothetical protein
MRLWMTYILNVFIVVMYGTATTRPQVHFVLCIDAVVVWLRPHSLNRENSGQFCSFYSKSVFSEVFSSVCWKAIFRGRSRCVRERSRCVRERSRCVRERSRCVAGWSHQLLVQTFSYERSYWATHKKKVIFTKQQVRSYLKNVRWLKSAFIIKACWILTEQTLSWCLESAATTFRCRSVPLSTRIVPKMGNDVILKTQFCMTSTLQLFRRF